MISAALPLSFSWLAAHFADVSRVSSGALIAAIWQGALLAVIAALALRLVPRIPAAARFAVWFAVFTLIAALPFVDRPSLSGATTASAPAYAFLSLDARWTLAIAALWAAASLVRAATLIASALRVRTLSRSATPLALSGALNSPTTRRTQVCSSTEVDRPTVIGFFSPKILIPAWLLEKLTPAELDQVILHEAGHLNRADDWLNLLQKFALVLFPLNPALAWVERRLCFEREVACDERVLNELRARNRGSATGYASCLATLAEYRLQRRGLVHNLALALGLLGASFSTSARESELGRRVARILRPVAGMRPMQARLTAAGAVLTLLLTATQLERCPQLVSFAPAASPQLAALSTSMAPAPALLPGFHAVTARLALPAAPQVRATGDAAPRLSAAHTRATAPAAPAYAQRRVGSIYAQRRVGSIEEQTSSVPRLITARQVHKGGQDGVLVTRYIVTAWQSSDGSRIVRTSAIISSVPSATDENSADRNKAGAPSRLRLGVTQDPTANPQALASARAQQISQPISPYAAVPVPGGWLVFQL